MVNKHLSANPPSEYSVGEKVFVRLSRRTKPLEKRRFVIEAIIKNRNLKRQFYQVSYISPSTKKSMKKWVQVNDITSLTLDDEKRRQKLAKSKAKRIRVSKAHHQKYYIPMTRPDLQEAIKSQGFPINHNQIGDGNCQFASLANQLRNVEIFRSLAQS